MNDSKNWLLISKSQLNHRTYPSPNRRRSARMVHSTRPESLKTARKKAPKRQKVLAHNVCSMIHCRNKTHQVGTAKISSVLLCRSCSATVMLSTEKWIGESGTLWCIVDAANNYCIALQLSLNEQDRVDRRQESAGFQKLNAQEHCIVSKMNIAKNCLVRCNIALDWAPLIAEWRLYT